MDDTTGPGTTPTTETTPIVPTAVETGTEHIEAELAPLSDDQVEQVIAEAIAAAEAAAAAEDYGPAFDTAATRAEVGHAVLSARRDKAAALAAQKDRAARLAASRPSAAAVPSVADIAKTTPAVPQERGLSFSLMVPSDADNVIPGLRQGTEFSNMLDVARVLDKSMSSVVGMKNNRTREKGLVEIRRSDSRFTVTGVEADDSVIRAAADQKRLHGGNLMSAWEKSALDKAGGNARRVSLTAAAGWCAPSETYYDLCEMESLDGLIDLPEVTATRGGIRWTQEPTYPALFAATAFTSLTEAQVIANTPKNCDAIDCPSFTDTRLNVAVTCLTASLLQNRGYPELVARTVRGELVVHAHKLNAAIIDALVATAGAATAIATPVDDSATAAILSAVELAATDVRIRNALADSAVVEVVLPSWVPALMRADYTRRNHGDPGVADAMIMDWFMVRNVRPQFVRDWQDFYGGVAAPSLGSGAPFVTSFPIPPATVNFLVFPAGSVVLARQDVITLRNVYDSTNLAQNLYTELFFEEGWAPIYPCAEIRQYSVLACPNGATGSQVDYTCTP